MPHHWFILGVQLIEEELIRADINEDERCSWIKDVERFVTQDSVRQSIATLFLQPDAHLAPRTFVIASNQLENSHTLPDGFSWQFIAKRFATKIEGIRQSSTELKETFESLAKAQDSSALQELAPGQATFLIFECRNT